MSVAPTYTSLVNDEHQHPAGVLWACVEEGFHVGSRDGEFLGYVDRQPDGHYLAFDARSHRIGEFSALHEATTAVLAASESPMPPSGASEDAIGVS